MGRAEPLKSYLPIAGLSMTGRELDAMLDHILGALRSAWKTAICPLAGSAIEEMKDGFAGIERVSEADRRSSNLLIAAGRRYFADSYTEEEHGPSNAGPATWQFDPLDGTDPWLRGLLHWTAIHAALLVRNSAGDYTAERGILLRPHDHDGKESVWYQDGSGTVHHFHDGGEVPYAPPGNAETLRAGVTKFYLERYGTPELTAELEKTYENLAGRLGKRLELVEVGATGSSIDDLLCNRVDVIVQPLPISKEWDVAVSAPLVRGLGGYVQDLNGVDLTSFRRADPVHRQGVLWGIGVESAAVRESMTEGLFSLIRA